MTRRRRRGQIHGVHIGMYNLHAGVARAVSDIRDMQISLRRNERSLKFR